jgi:hypothetical protein
MSGELSLDKMSIAQKIELMAVLWEDLSRNAQDYPSPEWHGEELARRRASAKEGKDELVDLDRAIQEIRCRPV